MGGSVLLQSETEKDQSGVLPERNKLSFGDPLSESAAYKVQVHTEVL
jgi:hypothetical protein